MKKKILLLLIALMPMLLIAQIPEDASPEITPALREWDEHFVNVATFEFLNKIITNSTHHVTSWTSIAIALASIFAMMAISLEAFKMLSLDSNFSFMPIVRPFVIGMIIFNWAPFISIVAKPGLTIQKMEEQLLVAQFDELNKLTNKRYMLLDEYIFRLNAMEKDFMQEESEGEGFISKVTGIFKPFGNMISDIKAQISIFRINMKMMLEQFLQFTANLLFQVGIYGLLFLQYSFFNILATVGSVVFAFSIIPAFKDLWSAWMMRFLSVTFWGAIGFLVLKLGLVLHQVNIESNIEFLEGALGSVEGMVTTQMIAHTQTSGIDFSIVISAIMSLLSLLVVPTISAWVFNTSSVGAASKAIVSAAIGAAGMAGVSKMLKK